MLLLLRQTFHSLLTTYNLLTTHLTTHLTTRCASCAEGGGAPHTYSRAGDRSGTPTLTTAACRCPACVTRRTLGPTTRACATATAASRERPAPRGTAPSLGFASPPRARRRRGGSGHWPVRPAALELIFLYIYLCVLTRWNTLHPESRHRAFLAPPPQLNVAVGRKRLFVAVACLASGRGPL